MFIFRWWTFRSWGRIGTIIGNNKLEEYEDLNDAMTSFNAIYEEKTCNRFTATEFKKKPGFWYILDIDYGQVSVYSCRLEFLDQPEVRYRKHL